MHTPQQRQGDPQEFQRLCDALKGKDVVLDGTTVGGTRFERRQLKNITVRRSGNGGIVVGWCEENQAVRSFKLSNLTRMELVP